MPASTVPLHVKTQLPACLAHRGSVPSYRSPVEPCSDTETLPSPAGSNSPTKESSSNQSRTPSPPASATGTSVYLWQQGSQSRTSRRSSENESPLDEAKHLWLPPTEPGATVSGVEEQLRTNVAAEETGSSVPDSSEQNAQWLPVTGELTSEQRLPTAEASCWKASTRSGPIPESVLAASPLHTAALCTVQDGGNTSNTGKAASTMHKRLERVKSMASKRDPTDNMTPKQFDDHILKAEARRRRSLSALERSFEDAHGHERRYPCATYYPCNSKNITMHRNDDLSKRSELEEEEDKDHVEPVIPTEQTVKLERRERVKRHARNSTD